MQIGHNIRNSVVDFGTPQFGNIRTFNSRWIWSAILWKSENPSTIFIFGFLMKNFQPEILIQRLWRNSSKSGPKFMNKITFCRPRKTPGQVLTQKLHAPWNLYAYTIWVFRLLFQWIKNYIKIILDISHC